jgi:hypothetical protein
MHFVWSKIRTWKRDGFKLVLYDTHVPTGRGFMADTLLAYRFSDGGRVIFSGRGFAPPLGVAIDSDECVAACLFAFCLRPGDVEEEFFDGYTARQRAWLETDRVDELYALVRDVEASAE